MGFHVISKHHYDFAAISDFHEANTIERTIQKLYSCSLWDHDRSVPGIPLRNRHGGTRETKPLAVFSFELLLPLVRKKVPVLGATLSQENVPYPGTSSTRIFLVLFTCLDFTPATCDGISLGDVGRSLQPFARVAVSKSARLPATERRTSTTARGFLFDP